MRSNAFARLSIGRCGRASSGDELPPDDTDHQAACAILLVSTGDIGGQFLLRRSWTDTFVAADVRFKLINDHVDQFAPSLGARLALEPMLASHTWATAVLAPVVVGGATSVVRFEGCPRRTALERTIWFTDIELKLQKVPFSPSIDICDGCLAATTAILTDGRNSS